MSTNQYPGERPQKSGTSSCLKVGGMGCLVIVLVVVGLVIGLVKSPLFQRSFQQSKLMAECSANLGQLTQPLNRYAADHNGSYPATLAELYPKYVSDQKMLQCPTSGQKGAVCSYDYTRPAPTAPGNTIVIVCRHHTMVQGQPPSPIELTKGGTIITVRHMGGHTRPPATTRP